MFAIQRLQNIERNLLPGQYWCGEPMYPTVTDASACRQRLPSDRERIVCHKLTTSRHVLLDEHTIHGNTRT